MASSARKMLAACTAQTAGSDQAVRPARVVSAPPAVYGARTVEADSLAIVEVQTGTRASSAARSRIETIDPARRSRLPCTAWRLATQSASEPACKPSKAPPSMRTARSAVAPSAERCSGSPFAEDGERMPAAALRTSGCSLTSAAGRRMRRPAWSAGRRSAARRIPVAGIAAAGTTTWRRLSARRSPLTSPSAAQQQQRSPAARSA